LSDSFRQEVVLSLKDDFSKQAETAQKNTSNLSKAMKVLAGAAVAGAVVKGLTSATRAFIEQERVVARQNAALKGLGITSQSASREMQSFATAMQRQTGISDDAVLKSTTLLTQFGLVGDELQRTTKAAADLSSALGQDLQSSTQILARAAEGNISALRRYGISIDSARFEAEGMAAVLDEIEKKFGGTAQAEAASFAGQINVLKGEFADLSKVIGESVVNLIQKTGVLQRVSKFVTELNDAIQVNRDEVSRAALAVNDQAAAISRLQDELKDWEVQVKRGQITQGQFLKIEERINQQIEEQTALLNERQKEFDKVSEFRQSDIKLMEEEQKAASTRRDLEKQAQIEKEQSEKMRKEAIKSAKEERKTYEDLYRTLIQENRSSFQTIWELRNNDIERLKKWRDEGVIAIEEYGRALRSVQQRSFTQMAGQARTGMDAIGAAANGSFNEALTGITSLMPPQMQAITGFAQSAVSTISSVMRMFGSDTRTEFEKMSGYISKVNREMSQAMSELQAFRAERDALESGVAGIMTGGDAGLDDKDFLKSIGVKGQLFGLSQKNIGRMQFRGQVAEDGTIVIFSGTRALGFINPDGSIQLRQAIGGQFGESQTIAIIRRVADSLLESGRLQNPGDSADLGEDISGFRPGFRSGGLVPRNGRLGDTVPAMLEGGEFVVAKNRVNQNTLGMLKGINEGRGDGASSSFVFHIQTMDASGVRDFVQMKLQPILRDLSRNQNAPMIAPRGVSSRA